MITRPSAVLCALAIAACDSQPKTASAHPASAPQSSAMTPEQAGTTAPAGAAATAAAPAPDSLLDAADRGRVLGSERATVWMLVVSDFQCPFCKEWHDKSFALLKRDYVDSGKIRLAYLNFPLSQHANAMPSAIAATCASAQGKFWPTEDRIFATQKTWETLKDPTQFLDSLAIASGADAARQHECSRARKVTALIDRDQLRMRQAGVQSTPTFFVGAARIEGAQPMELFRKVIDSVIAVSAKR